MLPIAWRSLALTLNLFRPYAAPGGCPAVRRLHHANAPLRITRHHLGRRVTKAIAIAGLHQRPARLHRIEQGIAGGGAAAVVGRKQDVGTQLGLQREFGLLPGLQITGEQGSALPCSG